MTDHVHVDDTIRSLDHELARVARGTVNVLLLGETGTGKEVFAERIHQLSPRAAFPLVRINCAALTDSLLESELFGHARGAFTGALASRVGLIEAADGGSVLLDEIGELPLATQAKLLRVIEERAVTPIGSTQPRRIDVRFIAATNRDLPDEVVQRRFRSDLLFRVGAYVVRLPPLRERGSAIEPLARMFLARAGSRAELSPAARAILASYAWPGNIRQLRNVIETAALLCDGATIEPCHLHLVACEEPDPGSMQAPQRCDSPSASLRDELAQRERELILRALGACSGNQRQTARALGISRTALLARLDRLAIPRPRKGRKLA